MPTTDLEKAPYIALSTFRRDGREVATPVWFVKLGGRVYVGTLAHSGKARRVRATGSVRFSVCNHSGRRRSGPTYQGTARIVPETAQRMEAAAALRRKYGFKFALAMAFYWVTGNYKKRTMLEITFKQRAGGEAA